MDYKEKIVELLKENMTEKSFKLWSGIDKHLPDIWSKLTASTRKYHRKLNGEVQNIAEHTYDMLFSAVKICRLFGINLKTTDFDKILFAIVLHDSLKYGTLGSRRHTDNKHDKYAADMISENKKIFEKILSEEQFYIMEEAVRFHSGRWSTDVPKNKDFSFKDYNPETQLVHTLDMMSSADLIQTDMRE